MSATILDLRAAPPALAEPIASLDAEMGVIGAALFDNALADHAEGLEPHHFFDPFFGRIWAAIQSLIADRQCANIPTVAARIGSDEALRDYGGPSFLFDLWNKAGGNPATVRSLSALIIEMHSRRYVAALAAEAGAAITAGSTAAAAIGDLEGGLLALQARDKRPSLVSALTASSSVLAYLDTPEADSDGILTGIGPLDESLGRLLPDDLILVAGRPGAGKSALGACISLNVARAGLGVIEVNSEMSTDQMMRRHLTDLCFDRWGADAPTYKDIRRRRVTPGQRGMLHWAAETIRDLPLCMVKRTGLTLSALRSMVRRQAAVWAGEGITLGTITVDHVGLLTTDERARDRYQEQTAIAIGMKALADELHIPLIALVQLSRKIEDRDNKRPMLPDMRDSGAWEENADVVLGIYREAYYAIKESEPKGKIGRLDADAAWAEWDQRRRSKKIEAIILKVREGQEDTVNLWASIGHNAIRGESPDQGGFL